MNFLDQTAVFGHHDYRVLFIIGNQDDKNLILMYDVRKEESILLSTSEPINDMTEQEIITEAKRIKSLGLEKLNGF